MSHQQRSATNSNLAAWLVDTARKTGANNAHLARQSPECAGSEGKP